MGLSNSNRTRLPEWLRAPGRFSPGVHELKSRLRDLRLHTVCESARCPNLGECFQSKTATFLLLGDRCTRSCGFCAIDSGRPTHPDPNEPDHVAQMALELGLAHVVLTSVNRDDLPDGGAGQFVRTIHRIRELLPSAAVEVLTPDFLRKEESVRSVCQARPDVYNHNVETVPRLYKTVRRGADYEWSLGLIALVKRVDPGIPTKSGLMVGLGEKPEEVHGVMRDLASRGCDILTIGQYCQPTKNNLPVVDYVHPDMFESYRRAALDLGFQEVFAGPLVRSSYHAGDVLNRMSGHGPL